MIRTLIFILIIILFFLLQILLSLRKNKFSGLIIPSILLYLILHNAISFFYDKTLLQSVLREILLNASVSRNYIDTTADYILPLAIICFAFPLFLISIIIYFICRVKAKKKVNSQKDAIH